MITHNIAMTFSDEQAMILDSARDFCRDKSPVTAVRALIGSESGFDASVWQEQIALGWAGLAIPEQYGGSGLGVGSIVSVAEQMGRHLLATPLLSSTLAAQAILRAGNEAQREAWLPRLAAGSAGTLAILDNEDWGDSCTRCKLEPVGGGYRLKGEKWYVTDAETAEIFVVVAELDGDPVLVLVARDASVSITPHTLIDETKRASKIDFSACQVEGQAILKTGNFEEVFRDIKLLGALLVAAEAAGSAGACLDTIVEYLNTRKQFGRLIGSYQALKHTTVNVLTEIDSARSHIYNAASLVGGEKLGVDAEIACRMAKAQASDTLAFAGDRAVQFHGGMGFTYECNAQLFIRRAQWAQQHYGDALHHRKRLATLLLD
jgi:acyl-CoA dehydrogenase